MMTVSDKLILRNRLSFLFLQLQELDPFLQQNELTTDEGLAIITLVFSSGVYVILRRREEGAVFLYERQTDVDCAKMIEQVFNRMKDEIYSHKTSGLPITLTHAKTELIIKTGIEQLTDELFNLLNHPSSYGTS